ncbi:TetR/AcrR family transcriptional regulator [Nocardia brasiliensis]
MANQQVKADRRVLDPRFQRSRMALTAAMAELVDLHPVAEISISRVVESAGVTRPTFYQHFADIPAAARAAGLARLDAACPIPEPIVIDGSSSIASLNQAIAGQFEPDLRHIFDHRVFYLRILDGAGNVDFFDELVEFSLRRTFPESFELAAGNGAATAADLMAVLAGGLTWLIVHWLRDQAAQETPEGMSQRIANVATTLLAGAPITLDAP